MVEPMALNPVVWLYRALTPGMRTRDEHPLLPRDIRLIRRHFRTVNVRAQAMLSIVSLVFLYVPRAEFLMNGLKKLLDPVDRFLFTVLPFTKYFAWAAFIEAKDPIRTAP